MNLQRESILSLFGAPMTGMPAKQPTKTEKVETKAEDTTVLRHMLQELTILAQSQSVQIQEANDTITELRKQLNECPRPRINSQDTLVDQNQGSISTAQDENDKSDHTTPSPSSLSPSTPESPCSFDPLSPTTTLHSQNEKSTGLECRDSKWSTGETYQDAIVEKVLDIQQENQRLHQEVLTITQYRMELQDVLTFMEDEYFVLKDHLCTTMNRVNELELENKRLRIQNHTSTASVTEV
ncbi:hypothetical protein IWQ62_003415 [Dispira parvispora]|uniref:Uncharacterized protein n=1 Tax=Dispira parvispora TaxID=1520584 RepID=A0A9W8E730_9FUNG|nr:hypothetical protein IWQ62_003415 [Dispira parvispora]